MDFYEKKSVFCEESFLTYPMQLWVLGRTSVEPTTPGHSQRGRLLGAVAQWQLRLCFLFEFHFPNMLTILKSQHVYVVFWYHSV